MTDAHMHTICVKTTYELVEISAIFSLQKREICGHIFKMRADHRLFS